MMQRSKSEWEIRSKAQGLSWHDIIDLSQYSDKTFRECNHHLQAIPPEHQLPTHTTYSPNLFFVLQAWSVFPWASWDSPFWERVSYSSLVLHNSAFFHKRSLILYGASPSAIQTDKADSWASRFNTATGCPSHMQSKRLRLWPPRSKPVYPRWSPMIWKWK